MESSFPRFNHVGFNFGVGSLEQSVKLGRLVILVIQREFDLQSQVWFQTKITRHEVQLPLYYIHFEIAQKQDLVSSNILLMQYWAGLIHISIFGGKS